MVIPTVIGVSGSVQKGLEKTGGIENQKMNRDHPVHGITNIG